ncbi:ABC transporter permease [Pseudonocardia xishanensis]|uniref:ABC transporter permease n=1 Tax=Pseudonocardia xishanensis TaxID=630995 RepID=A0ABP8S260_9PSEU
MSVLSPPTAGASPGRSRSALHWEWGYVSRRVLQAVGILWATYTLSFLILFAIPGDPALLMLGGAAEGGAISPEDLAAVNAQYGFDQPLVLQYLAHLASTLHGDLGTSFAYGAPVTSLLTDSLGSTTALVIFAMTVATVVGMLIGCLAGAVRLPWLARLLEALPAGAASVPTFWIGLLLMQRMSFQLRLLPVSGDRGFASLVMPGLTLAVPASAYIAQVVARSVRGSLREPYVDVARAKGAGELRVFVVHALRTAAPTVLTVAGLVVATMFVTATITETIFARRGIGFLLEGAITVKDIPVVQAVVLVVAAVYVTINLLVDLVHPLLDPRTITHRRRPAAQAVST